MNDPVRLREVCEGAYARFHDPALIAPDPLEVVREYASHRDREVVALIAASLALGRVDGILTAVRNVMSRIARIGPSPAEALVGAAPGELDSITAGFRYRFFDQDQLCGLLEGVRRTLLRHGSLEAAFAVGFASADVSGRAVGAAAPRDAGIRGAAAGDALVAGLAHLVEEVREGASGRLDASILLARPGRGSACKRLLLFARWMVRRDRVDPGGWRTASPRDLLVPVDTHVLRVARRLGITRRNQASLLVAREITDAMRAISPEDPVRYDFALTRPGIHPLLDEAAWLDGECTRSA